MILDIEYIGNLNLRARISGYVCLQTKTKKNIHFVCFLLLRCFKLGILNALSPKLAVSENDQTNKKSHFIASWY